LENQCRDLAAKAVQDALTGTTNRAEFDRELVVLVSDPEQRGSECSLIVADLDFFKEINDTYGHQCGDEVLKVFARILLTHRRQADLVARYGGEEFVILLPSTPLEVAWQRAEAIRAAIANEPIPGLRGRTVTSSFGVTQFHVGDSAESFLNRADRALYIAKQQGRNRTVQINVSNSPTQDGFDAEPNSDGSIETSLLVSSSGETAMLKLTGFIADHDAEVLYQDAQMIRMRVGHRSSFRERFWLLRPNLPIEITLNFQPARRRNRTPVWIGLRPEVPPRHQAAAQNRSIVLLASLRGYLMAE
jgi:diguanylate cyclase (GGDEF)-like protein